MVNIGQVLLQKGYIKIIGMNFSNNYLAVLNDITLGVILHMWLIKNRDPKLYKPRNNVYMHP